MTSTHEALVRRPFGEVQRQLHDLDWVLAALPGATLKRDADGASGSLRLKLDGHQITYRVTIRGTGPEPGVHAVTVAASGKEARGDGILGATVQIELHDDHDDDAGSTLIRVLLDATATGRGASVSGDAWGRAADTMLAGVVGALDELPAATVPTVPTAPEPTPDGTITATPAPGPRAVPLATAAARPIAPARRSSSPPPHLLAAIAAVAAMILVVLRWRSRRRSA
jgi:carbon monoxide dehydrogenase subunit G